MALSFRLGRFSLAAILLGCLLLSPGIRNSDAQPTDRTTLDSTLAEPAQANELIRRQPGFFVPNLGQWEHPSRFVHRSGPMTLFLEERGWVVDLVEVPAKSKARPRAVYQAVPSDRDVDQKIHGVALRMTFERDAYVPEIVGEKKLPGHHNYFLGNDENRWRTGVPLYVVSRKLVA